MQIFETSNKKQFDDFLIQQNASVLQSWEWGEFQKRVGHKVWRLLVTSNVGKIRGAATVLSTALPQGKTYLYCPRGPVFSETANLDAVWKLFLDKLSDIVVLEKPIFLRIDPQIENFGPDFKLEKYGFHKLGRDIQAKDNLIIDISGRPEDILHAMKPKTRYNIRLSQKKDIVINQTRDTSMLKLFWQLISETSKRDGFSTHSYNYYFNLLKTLGKSGNAELFLAMYHARPLAAGLISYFGSTATYLHGASSSRLRALMAPYLMQWTSMTSAKNRGMRYYDLGGIAPEGAKNHAWAGITQFKKGFGGKQVSYIGTYDLVYNKFWYAIYKIARSLNRMV